MTIETALIAGLGLAFLFLFLEYVKVRRELGNAKEVHHRSLENAHQKALEILDEARTEALKILKSAHLDASTNKQKLSEKMDVAINTVANREIEDFKKVLQTETLEVEKAVGEKVAKRYDEVAAEIEAYRHKQLETVDERVKELVKAVGQKIVGHTISMTEHTDLVIKSLEEAKRDGMFN